MSSSPNVIGSVAVSVGADLDPLLGGLAQAEALSKRTGASVAGDLSKIEAGAERAERAVDGLADAETRAAKTGRDLGQVQGAVAEGTARVATNSERAAREWQRTSAQAEAHTRALRAMAQAQAAIDAASGGRSGADYASRASDIAAYGAELDRVRAKFNPLFAAGQAYRSQLAEIAQAARVGAINETERAAAVTRTKEAFTKQVEAIRSNSGAVAINAHQWQNLGFQVNDVFSSLASGASPMMVIAQQSGQIYQALDGPKGVVGGLKEVGNFLLGLLTPARIAAGGILGLGVAALAALASWKSAESEMRQGLAGVGRAAGVTVGELERIAVATASASGTSIAEARALALELAKTGKIAKENLQPIASLGKDFAASAGLDLVTAGQELARAFADPAKGADDLNRRIGFLDDTTRRYIARLDAQGDRTKAQQTLMQALKSDLSRASDLTSGWAAAWDRVANAASNAWNYIGKAVDRATGGAGDRTEQEIAATLQTRLEQLRARRVTASDFDLEGIDRLIAQLQTRLDKELAKIQKAQQQSAHLAKNDLSTQAGLIARSTVSETVNYQKIADDREVLNRAVAQSVRVDGEAALALRRHDAALEDYAKAGGAVALMEQKRALTSELVLKAQKARTPEEVGAVAAERARIDLLGTLNSESERNAQMERARKEATSEARKAIEEQSATLARTAEGENRVAAAHRTSSEALVLRAEASRRAADDTARGLPAQEQEGRAAEYLRERLAQLKKERAQATAEMSRQTDAQVAVNRDVDAGKVAVERASEALQRELDIRRLMGQAALAEGQDRADLLKMVDELSAAYQRQDSARADAAAQGMLKSQEQEIAQLRLEVELIGKSTAERERALAVLRAIQEAQRQGISLTSTKGQKIIDNAAVSADLRTVKSEYERTAQDLSNIVSGIFDDLMNRTNSGITGILGNISRSFSRLGTRYIEQNFLAPLLAGEAPKVANDNAPTITASTIKNAVRDGAEAGTSSGVTTSFTDLFGKENAGIARGAMGALALGSSYGAGAASSSGTQAVISGAMSGAVGGAMLGAELGAGLGPAGAVAGAALGAIISWMGFDSASNKRKKQQLKQYKDEYEENLPQITQFRAGLRGEATTGIENTINQIFQQYVQAARAAAKAGDMTAASEMDKEFISFVERTRWNFIRGFEGLLKDLQSGLGPSGPYAQANAAVVQLGEALKAFVSDAQKLPEAETNVARARSAAIEAALKSLEVPESLSEVQERLRAIEGAGAALQQVLVDLGMSADEAAAAIKDRTAVAMDALRASFSADLDSKINAAKGQDYKNEIGDLIKERDALLADANAIGAGTGKVAEYFRAAAQRVIDSSELTGDAFKALVRQFPALKGAVVEFGQAIDTAAAKAEAAARALGYQDRTFAAGNDTSTLAGALAAQDRKAAQDRAAEAKAGGRAMADLEKALAAERTAIIKDFAARAAEAEAAAREAGARRILSAEDRIFAARNDASTLTGKLAEMDHQHAQERLDEATAGGQAMTKLVEAQAAERLKIVREAGAAEVAARKAALAEAQTFLDGATKNIRTYLDGLKAGPETNLSPGDRLKEAQRQFDAQLKLAKGGDRDALSSLTTYADRLLDAGKGQYASGKGYQDILGSVTKQLGALPKQVSAEQFIVDAIKAQTTALQTAIGTGSAAETAKALSGSFSKLDTNTNGLLSQKEFLAALGPKATVAEQQAALTVFREIDLNGDGQLSKLELARAQLKGAIEANRPALIQKALAADFTKLDTSANGLLSPEEFLAGLGPLATAAEQAAAMEWFRSIDENGDGQLSKLELLRGQMVTALTVGGPQAMATAIKTNFPKLDINRDGLLSKAEFLAGLGPLASKEEQAKALAVFRAIDLDGDGQISKLEALRTSLGSNLTGINDVTRAVKDNFSRLDTNGSGGLSLREFKAAFGPLATKADQQLAEAYFASIDADGDKVVTKLELARVDLLAGLKLNEPSKIAAALKTNFPTIDVNSDGGITYDEYVQALGPLATKAEQEKAKRVFDAIDADGNNIVTKMEAVRFDLLAQLKLNDPAKMAAALSSSFAEIDLNKDKAINLDEYLKSLGKLTTAQRTDAQKLFTAMDRDKSGTLTPFELAAWAIVDAVKANSPTAFATALDANFTALNTTVDGVLDKDELATAIKGLATAADQEKARSWIETLDKNNNKQLSPAELAAGRLFDLKGLTTNTTKAVNDNKTATDSATTAVNNGTSTAKEMKTVLSTISTLAGLQKTAMEAIQGYQRTSNDNLATAKTSLAEIQKLSTTQKAQLELLNKQFTLESPVAVANSNQVLNNGMLSALNKIVFNTGQTVNGLIKLMSTKTPDGLAFAFAEGGWVRGPGSGTSDSIGARLSNGEFVVNAAAARLNAPFLEAMNDNRPLMMPALAMPVSVPGAGMDAGALLAELRLLRAEQRDSRAERKALLEMVARITKAGADKVADKVEETTDEVAGSREDARRDAAPKRAGRGEPVRSAA